MKFHETRTIITSNLHKDQYKFLIISRSVLLRMRNASDKGRRQYKNTHVISSNSFSSNVEKYCRAGQTTDDNMVHSHCIWIPKATNKRSGYVIRIAFPRQQ